MRRRAIALTPRACRAQHAAPCAGTVLTAEDLQNGEELTTMLGLPLIVRPPGLCKAAPLLPSACRIPYALRCALAACCRARL